MRDTSNSGEQPVCSNHNAEEAVSKPNSDVARGGDAFASCDSAPNATSQAHGGTPAVRTANVSPLLQPGPAPDWQVTFVPPGASRKNSESTTTSSTKSKRFLADIREISRTDRPGEGLLAPAVYSAIKERQMAGRAATSSTPRKSPKAYLAELGGISRSSSMSRGEGEFFSATASKVHEKQRRYAEKKAARKASNTEAHFDTAQLATEQSRPHNRATEEPPVWQEYARAAEYQQAIQGVPEKLEPPPRLMPGPVSTRDSGSTRRSGSIDQYRSMPHAGDGNIFSTPSHSRHTSATSYSGRGSHEESPLHKRSLSKSRGELDTLKGIASATAGFGDKLKTRIHEYNEKRDHKREEKKAKQADERKARVKAAISGPVEAKGRGPIPGWGLLGPVVHLDIKDKEKDQLERRAGMTTAPVDQQALPMERLPTPPTPDLPTHQSRSTTFAAFINRHDSTDETPPSPLLPEERRERWKGKQAMAETNPKPDVPKALGHRLEDMTSTLRSRMAHLPHFHKADSDESFECIGAGTEADGKLVMPEIPPEAKQRPDSETNTDIIAAYGTPSPGFEQMPGPYRPEREKRNNGTSWHGTARRDPKRDTITDIRAAQAIATMPEGMGSSVRGPSMEREPRARSKRDTTADIQALAGLPSMPEGMGSGGAHARVDSMQQHGEEVVSPAKKRAAAGKASRDTAYVSVYSRNSGRVSPLWDEPSPIIPPVPRLNKGRDSWEDDEDVYVPPRKAWRKAQLDETRQTDRRAGRAGRAPENSYYRMVERDRARGD